MLIWYPDCCTTGQCRVEVDKSIFPGVRADINNFIGFIKCCSYHQSLRDSGLIDEQVFAATKQSVIVRESARWAAKLSLGLDKEYPGVPYRVEPDGTFTLGVQRQLKVDREGKPVLDEKGQKIIEWAKIPEWPADTTKLQADINSLVAERHGPIADLPVRLA